MKIVKNFSPKNIKAVASSSGVVKYELLDLDVYTDVRLSQWSIVSFFPEIFGGGINFQYIK